MTIDLSRLPARRRAPIVERYQRELVAELVAGMYPDYVARYGDERAFAEIRRALIAEGHPEAVCTVRFVRRAAREGR